MSGKFNGFDWQELTQYWGVEFKQKEYPEFEGKEPSYDTMENYRTKDGYYSWSDWWSVEASDEYKKHIKEFGKIKNFNEQSELEAVRKYMHDSFYNGTKDQIAKDLREFITVLYEESEKIDYQSPVWKALLELEDDGTLIKFTSLLLPMMWT